MLLMFLILMTPIRLKMGVQPRDMSREQILMMTVSLAIASKRKLIKKRTSRRPT